MSSFNAFWHVRIILSQQYKWIITSLCINELPAFWENTLCGSLWIMKQDQNKCVKTLEKLGIIYRQKTLLGMGKKNEWLKKKKKGGCSSAGLDGFPNVSKRQTKAPLDHWSSENEAALNIAEFNHRLMYWSHTCQNVQRQR